MTQLTLPPPQTALESLDRRRFLISSWPWRSLSYVLTALPVTFVVAVALDLVILPWARLIRSGPGEVRAPGLLVILIVSGTALLLAAGPLAARTLARVERRRLSLALLILAAIITGPLLARGQLSLALGPVRVRSQRPGHSPRPPGGSRALWSWLASQRS